MPRLIPLFLYLLPDNESSLLTVKTILQNLYALQSLDLAGGRSPDGHAATLRAAIPDGLLANYDRARARGKKGIALLNERTCNNCRMQVPIAVVASLKAGMIQVCGNCGLYLCLPQVDEQPAAAPANEAPAPRPRKKRSSASALQPSGAAVSSGHNQETL